MLADKLVAQIELARAEAALRGARSFLYDASSVARTMNVLAGGSAILLSSSLQRHTRDAEAIMHHFTQTPHTWEEAGRVLLGRTPTVPVF